MNRITSDSLDGFGFTRELKELIDKYKRRGIIDVEADSKDMSLSEQFFGNKYDEKMNRGMRNLREQDETKRLTNK